MVVRVNEAEVMRQLKEVRSKSKYEAERLRAHIIISATSLRSKAEVSRVVGCSRTTVQKAVKMFDAGGVSELRDRRRENVCRPIKERAKILDLLPNLVSKQPGELGWMRSTWTVELVALEVARQLDIKVSRSHMGMLLREAGCRRVRPKTTIVKAPKDRVEQVLALHHELQMLPLEDDIFFADEVDVHLNPKVGPDWAPKGVRKELPTPGQNAKHYVAGALDICTQELVCVDGPKKTSDLFISLVDRLVERHTGKGKIHLVLDNYIIHHSKKTRKAVEKHNGLVVLHFLPPYCPDDNPIERVWLDLHTCVTRNHRHPVIEQLMAAVRHFCDNYAPGGRYHHPLAA